MVGSVTAGALIGSVAVLTGSTPAGAAPVIGTTQNGPAAVAVGATFSADILMAHTMGPEPALSISAIDLTMPDQGVFQLAATATGKSPSADNPTCDGQWTVSAADSSGISRFTPPGGEGSLVLTGGALCTVTYTALVHQVPANDVHPSTPGSQTQSVLATTPSTPLETGTRSSSTRTVTVHPASVPVSAQAAPAPAPGGTSTVTATLSRGSLPTGLPSPTGTMGYSLYGPSTAAICSPATAVGVIPPSAVDGFAAYSSPASPPLQPGTYWWIATYSGDRNHNAVSTSCGDPASTFTVSLPPAATLTWDQPDPIVYGTTAASSLDASASTGGPITYTATGVGGTTFGPAAITATTVLVAGTYDVTATHTPTAPAEPTPTATRTLTVTKAPLTMVVAPVTRAFGAANPNPYPTTLTGFVNGDQATTSSITGAPTCTPPGPSAAVATYTVACAPGTLAAPNYRFAGATGSLIVTNVATRLTVDPILVSFKGRSVKVTFGVVSARLTTPTGSAVAGRPVTFKAGATVLCTATTAASGVAQCTPSLTGTLQLLLTGRVSASTTTGGGYVAATGSAGLIG